MVTVKEVEVALLEHAQGVIKDSNINYYSRSNEDYWEWWYNRASEEFVVGLGVVEVEDRDKLSSDDDGEKFLVLKVTSYNEFGKPNERTFKKDGYYSSYDGATWDGRFDEVKKTTKTITVWE